MQILFRGGECAVEGWGDAEPMLVDLVPLWIVAVAMGLAVGGIVPDYDAPRTFDVGLVLHHERYYFAATRPEPYSQDMKLWLVGVIDVDFERMLT
jgi:hypothetical protein